MAELENQVAKEAATEETAKATEKAAPKKTAAKKAATPKAEVSKGASSKEINRVHAKYQNEVIDQLVKQFGYKNINQVPKLVKITINTGLGDVKDNPKSVQTAIAELTLIAGQKPITTTAKKSIANFKVRQNMMVGAKVDLRNERMYEFFDKLVSIALPRVRDFKGVPTKSFDGRGNYALGVKEQLIFPEISYETVEKIRGFDICFVTTAKTDDEARALLTMLGMPFAK